jgi:hypothetical protein
MEQLLGGFLGDYKVYLDLLAYVVILTSAIVRLTPTLKDDNILLPIIKFLSKFIAWNKYGPGGIEVDKLKKLKRA